MYGKLFERMYTGSMMGRGALMFAVWPYVIAHMKPNRDRTVFTVELNTQLMAILIGEKESDIEEMIHSFCEPDIKSRTRDNEGRKLIKIGTFLYEVVNGAIYDQIRREEELRESNRTRQKKHYHKKKQETDLESPETGTTPPADAPAKKEKGFKAPTLEDVKLAAAKTGLSEHEAKKFFAYYASNGWKVGKNPMKDWVKALTGWKLRSQENGNTNSGSGRSGGQSVDRNIGNANEGKAHLYRGLGAVSVPDREPGPGVDKAGSGVRPVLPANQVLRHPILADDSRHDWNRKDALREHHLVKTPSDV